MSVQEQSKWPTPMLSPLTLKNPPSWKSNLAPWKRRSSVLSSSLNSRSCGLYYFIIISCFWFTFILETLDLSSNTPSVSNHRISSRILILNYLFLYLWQKKFFYEESTSENYWHFFILLKMETLSQREWVSVCVCVCV